MPVVEALVPRSSRSSVHEGMVSQADIQEKTNEESEDGRTGSDR